MPRRKYIVATRPGSVETAARAASRARLRCARGAGRHGPNRNESRVGSVRRDGTSGTRSGCSRSSPPPTTARRSSRSIPRKGARSRQADHRAGLARDDIEKRVLARMYEESRWATHTSTARIPQRPYVRSRSASRTIVSTDVSGPRLLDSRAMTSRTSDSRKPRERSPRAAVSNDGALTSAHGRDA